MSSEINTNSARRVGSVTLGASETPGSRDIAVIGMAAKLPEADDLQQFLRNLRAGRDSVRELSADRIARTSLDPSERYQLCGYLDDIDTFDHAFFGISKGEAQTMAPEHRLLLQVAYQAIENAGYAPSSLEGVRAPVYVADTRIDYSELVPYPQPHMMMGTHVAAMAGRLSRFFGLRGHATMVDSACSSGLLGVHLAVNDLLLGDAELAMVCGASISVLAGRKTGEPDIGIRSADGKARAFSAHASGTGSGEAVAVVLLKTLAAARRDGDIVHAVIKGTAANNDSSRSSSLTAPDSDAQAEVIEMAWSKAGVDGATVSYIEAHGTGTPLGDPIEIEGINQAFARISDQKNFVALSTAKSNIGHTWSVAGLVGMIKAVLSLRARQLFPSLHAAELNPMIDFDSSAVSVTQELTCWEPSTGVRRAGVSSFGSMGTNVHAVLEEANEPPNSPTSEVRPSGKKYLVLLSGKSISSLRANAAALRDWIANRPELTLPDIERTLTAGRDHHSYRAAHAVSTLDELSDSLSALSPSSPPVQTTTVLLVSNSCIVTPPIIKSLSLRHPHFADLYQTVTSHAQRIDVHDHQFEFQYAFLGLLQHLGIHFDHVVTQSAGKLALDAANGSIALDDALRAASVATRVVPDDLDVRVDRLLEKFTGDGHVVFIEAGTLSTISEALEAREREHTYSVVALDESGTTSYLARLYIAGVSWKWDVKIGNGRRIELPAYQFDRIRCWLDDSQTRKRSIAPVAPVESAQLEPLEAVHREWLNVLGEKSDDHASFFDLGGDSISGLQVMNNLGALFQLDLDDYAIFDHDTPDKLANHIQSMLSAAVPSPSSPVNVPSGSLPASPAQVSIWIASQFDGGSTAFNLTRSFKLDGQVDCAAMQRAIDGLLSRHTGLCTSFVFRDSELIQTIVRAASVTAVFELKSIDSPRPDDTDCISVVRSFAAVPFDLEVAPLFRAQLLTFDDSKHIFTLSTHHIVADGWSLDILVNDFFAFYASFTRDEPAQLPALELDYKQHHMASLRTGGQKREHAYSYWSDQFKNVPASIDFPILSGIAEEAFRGAYHEYSLPEDLWVLLKTFAKSEGITPFMTILSGFAALLCQYTERGDMVIGTSLSGRGKHGAEQLVGMFVRTLPLRLEVNEENNFRTVLDQVRSRFTEGIKHSDFSYEELVQSLHQRGVTNAANLFNVLIEFEQFASMDRGRPAGLSDMLQVEPLDVTLQTSVFPLNIMLAEQFGTLKAAVRFDTRFFSPDGIDRLWRSFSDLLVVVLERPDLELNSIPHLDGTEQLRVLTLGSHKFSFDVTYKIHLAVEHFASTHPSRICLVAGTDQRSYSSLNSRANQLARYFRDELGIGAGMVVALVMDRSAVTVESILALWKCGAAYMPIDPTYPPAYARSMVESSQVNIVLVDPSRIGLHFWDEFGTSPTVIGVVNSTAKEYDPSNLGIASEDAAIAYVIYTSGSTGVPKGVMVEHLGMLNHLHSKINDLSLTDASVVAQNASSSFDISVWQMFAALYVGGITVLYDATVVRDPIRFGKLLDADQVTALEVVPSQLETMLDAWQESGQGPRLGSLANLVVTGEVVYPRSVNRWLSHYPQIPVVNAYGPTEASDDITHHMMSVPVITESVPLGAPIHNTEIYILDKYGRVCAQGATGEIYVSGLGVSRGYLNDPEQTARAFVQDVLSPHRRMYRTGDLGRWTQDGKLEYLGRRDSQVKMRGYRLDLGEIERRVNACSGVRSAAVVIRANGGDRLCAYVVLDRDTTVASCRGTLHAVLPHYMVPAEFIQVDQLPVTSNGKIDRKVLANANMSRPAIGVTVTPRTQTESLLIEIWREVLGTEQVGIHDDLFEIGGNSLRAVQIQSRVRHRLGIDVDLEMLFANSTIASLAEAIGRDSRASKEDAITSAGGPGIYPVAFTQELLLDIEQLYDRPDAFHRNDIYELIGDVDIVALERSFARLVERHEVLRTTFVKDNDSWKQKVHAVGGLSLPFRVHDFTKRSPAEIDAFAKVRIETAFDVRGDALIRVDLILTDQEMRLVMSMNQLISDGRTVDVLTEEWLSLYDEAKGKPDSELEPILVQYKDATTWRNARMTGRRLHEHREFWRQELSGASSVVPIASDRPRAAQTTFVAGVVISPSSDLTTRLARIAEKHAVTEFVVAKSAVSLLLFAETGRSDLVVGTYTRGRKHVELENQLGSYINIVPLRTRFEEGQTVEAFLSDGQRDFIRALEHEEYPYGWTMRDLGWQRGINQSPIFDVMIAVDVAERPKSVGGGAHLIEFRRRHTPRRAKEADLQFVFDRNQDGGVEVVVVYNAEIFEPERVENLTRKLKAIVACLLVDMSLGDIVKQTREAI